MFDLGNIQYLLTLSDGRQLNVFYSNNSGISLASTSRKGIWSPPRSIVRASLPYFCTSIDENDFLHIFHQDARGDLVHLLYGGHHWERMIVLTGKEPGPYDKCPFLLCINRKIYLFYVLRYSGKNLLSYQIIDENLSLSKPVAIDYIDSGIMPYKVFSGEDGLFIAYCRIRDDKKQYVFRKFEFTQETWGSARTMSVDSALYSLEAITSYKGKLVVCLKKKRGTIYSLYNHIYDFNDGTCISEDTIADEVENVNDAVIAVTQGSLICFWSDSTGLKITYSVNYIDCWSSPRPVKIYEGIPFQCFSIIGGNYDYESQFNIIPGKYTEGIKLALLDPTAIHNSDSQNRSATPPDSSRGLVSRGTESCGSDSRGLEGRGMESCCSESRDAYVNDSGAKTLRRSDSDAHDSNTEYIYKLIYELRILVNENTKEIISLKNEVKRLKTKL